MGGLQVDLFYVIKTRVGFKNAEMMRSINYIRSYLFALKNF